MSLTFQVNVENIKVSPMHKVFPAQRLLAVKPGDIVFIIRQDIITFYTYYDCSYNADTLID